VPVAAFAGTCQAYNSVTGTLAEKLTPETLLVATNELPCTMPMTTVAFFIEVLDFTLTDVFSTFPGDTTAGLAAPPVTVTAP
jgi:hypothetical protein